MPAPSRTSLQEAPLEEAPLDMTDMTTPQTPAPDAPPASTRPERSAARPDDPLRSEHTAPPAEHEPTAKPAAIGLSISANAALGFIGVLVTLFGSATIGLMLYTLNNLNDRITTVEANLNDRITTVEANLNDRITTVKAKIATTEANLNGRLETMDAQIAELSRQQADMGETLSVLVAILNARREVEAAKAHQITTPS